MVVSAAVSVVSVVSVVVSVVLAAVSVGYRGIQRDTGLRARSNHSTGSRQDFPVLPYLKEELESGVSLINQMDPP